MLHLLGLHLILGMGGKKRRLQYMFGNFKCMTMPDNIYMCALD